MQDKKIILVSVKAETFDLFPYGLFSRDRVSDDAYVTQFIESEM